MNKFIDTHELTVASGNGAPGCVSFRREKYIPKGGPDGGDGGDGGDIIFCSNNKLSSFKHLYRLKTIKAENGEPGRKKKQHGKNGVDKIIEVPPGTQIKDDNGLLIYDFTKPDDRFVLLKGGMGGKGNVHFATAVNQTPSYAQPGKPGKSAYIKIEIKLIADIGLVGFPNAGKSTFMASVTNARPKIASYPFTTLTPKLGIWELSNDYNVVLADIPGLIEGAHTGSGLGIEFLRHIERTRFLFIIIEATDKNPYESFKKLKRELAGHSTVLAEKPFMIGLSKTDLLQKHKDEVLDSFPKKLKGKCLFFSSVRHDGLDQMRKTAFLAKEKAKEGT